MLRRSSQRSFGTAPVAIALTWCLGVGSFLAGDRTRDPVGWDSVKYLESARNLLAGQGLVHSPHGLEPIERDVVPLQLFPPGFPTLVAAGSLVLGSVERSGIWLPRLSWMLAVVLVVGLLRILGASHIVLVAPALLLTAGVHGASSVVMSEGPFFVLVLASLLCLVQAARPGMTPSAWALASGVAAAAAHAVRNLGAAVLIALPLAVVAFAIHRRQSPREIFRLLGVWLLGATPVEIALRLRSLIVFGALESYSMSPSTIGPVDNLRWLAFAGIRDLTGFHETAMHVAWNGWLLASMGGGLLVFGAWCATTAFHDATDRRRPDCALALTALLALAASVAAVVVGVRSSYDWGEVIMPRHIGLVTLCGLVVVFAGLSAVARQRPALRLAAPVLAIALLGFHLHEMAVAAGTEPSLGVQLAVPSTGDAVRRSVGDGLVLSNAGPTLTWLSGRSVRQLSPRVDIDVALSRAVERVAGRRRVYFAWAAPVGDPGHSVAPRGFRGVFQSPLLSIFVSTR